MKPSKNRFQKVRAVISSRKIRCTVHVPTAPLEISAAQDKIGIASHQTLFAHVMLIVKNLEIVVLIMMIPVDIC